MRFAENLESTGEKCERLELERDDALEKCEALERILERVYGKCDNLRRELESVCRRCDSLKQKLESTTGRRVYLEKEVVDLRKRIRNLETEAAVQHVNPDDEIGRGRMCEAEIRQLREEIQQLQAELAEQSHDRSQTEVDQRGSAFTATTQSLQAVHHLQFSPEGSPADSVLADELPQKEVVGHTLYDIMDIFGDMHFGFQHMVETYHQRFHDPQNESRSAAEGLIGCSSSNVPAISVSPQAELNNPESVLARHQSMLQDDVYADKLSAMASNKTLKQQTNSIGTGPVTDQLAEFLPTSSLPTSQLPSQQLPELDPDTSSEDNDTESDQPNTNILFRSGSPRIQAAPTIHRVRPSTGETDQKDVESCLMPNLNTWEWSSVPGLQLWNPSGEK